MRVYMFLEIMAIPLPQQLSWKFLKNFAVQVWQQKEIYSPWQTKIYYSSRFQLKSLCYTLSLKLLLQYLLVLLSLHS